MRTLSVLVGTAALASAGAVAAAGIDKPQHVMSLNLCTDQLILMMLPKERIASVSFLSRASERPLLTAEAAGVGINFGTLEEVLAAKPDLVIAGTASTPTTRAFLKQAQIPLAEIPLANNFEEIRATTRAVGRAVGEDDKAESLIAKMDMTLAELAASVPSRRFVLAGWGGGGEVAAKGTLFDSILTVAGGINIAATMRDTRFGPLDFEQLLALRPDIIAFGDATSEQPGLRREQIQHRIVQRLYRNRQIAYPDALFGCGLPQAADAARDLRRAMLAIVNKTAP
jgi:iron complex transport system substrate-binding protein